MPQVMVFSERDEFAFELLAKGTELAGELKLELSAAVLGPDSKNRAPQYFAQGANIVYTSEDGLLAEFNSEIYAQALFQMATANQAELILLSSTRRGRELAPRLAQMLDAGCVSDAFALEVKEGRLAVSRYGLGGITIATEQIQTPKKVIAVIPHSFAFEKREPKPDGGRVVPVDLKLSKPRAVVVAREPKVRELVDLEKADVLVCVGRGLKRQEDLALIQSLADTVKGEVGCTQSLATDRQWLSEDRMVGTSGKRCKPKLVFSIGISGQSQHVAGIIGARIITAINNDKNAPIFKVADYGIVADLYQAVPRLIEKLKPQK